MDAIRSFLTKYHAVPATEAGPDWGMASDEALIGWAKADCRAWDEHPEARHLLIDRMADIGRELSRRTAGKAEDYRPEVGRLFAAGGHIYRRLGGGRA
jgi:hypothetical protein